MNIQPPSSPFVSSFQTILMDPPWLERGGGKIKRGANRHYPLLKTKDMLPVILRCSHWREIAEHSHLYMWTTNTFLKDALWLMDALDYRYVTNVVWVKDRVGLGQYFRGQHELLLFGTRGIKPTAPRTERRDLPSVISSPRGKHSAKPQESYDLIENRSKGPYLELFSRSPRSGWTAWGNEV